jgi:hypothetical protein
MRLFYPSLAAALLLGASSTASAQTITDPTAATTARDSLFQQAILVRQQIEQKSRRFVTKAPKTGARRIVVRGFYVRQRDNNTPDGKTGTPVAWEHVIKHYRNGSSRELYTAYLDEKIVLQERRHNGQLTWLRLQNYRDIRLSSIQPAQLVPNPKLSGTYTAADYVKWSGNDYLLPNRAPKP